MLYTFVEKCYNMLDILTKYYLEPNKSQYLAASIIYRKLHKY